MTMARKKDDRVLVYHGTSLPIALEIASCGALLSPFERELSHFRRVQSCSGIDISAINHGRSIEDLARTFAEGIYRSHERFRASTVSVARDYGTALGYAVPHDAFEGGIVLGIKMREKELDLCSQGSGRGIYYVQSRLDLADRLDVVYFSSKARMKRSLIVEKFAKYAPRFLDLCD